MVKLKAASDIWEKQQFLLRAQANKNITDTEFDEKYWPLERERWALIDAFMITEYETLRENMKTIKKAIVYDGDMKREMARVLIKIFEDFLTESEIKGIFRQGYKLMR